MTSLSVPTSTGSGLRAMAGIEARRLARHPVFLVGVVLAFAILTLMFFLDDRPVFVDLLSIPVIPAFFIGLTSLVATARLTRSTETAVEAVATAPGTESRRTTALALACLVPMAAGLAFIGVELAMAAARGVAPQEWWFGTLPGWQVWSILLALGGVSCFGGALLGVLTGRWVRFPGAAAVVVVAVVAICMVGQLPIAAGDSSELRLWLPWAMFHSGTMDDATALMYAGNPAAYLGYLLCLCALAALAAVWHDRAARTARLRAAIGGVLVVALACLALAITTGPSDNRVSPPNPYQQGR
jgi:hypothetical protein